MDLRAVFFMISLWKVTKSAVTYKPQQPENLETTPFPIFFIQMGCGLTAIPKGGPDVETINFGYNHISHLTPSVFVHSGFVKLNTIQLRRCQITSVSHKAFKGLTELKVLDMPENNISILDPNTLKTNINLKKLDLTNNRIRFRNRPFLNSQSLETLILSDNRIEQVFESTFTKLPNLRNLVMNSNVLFFIEDNSFVPMKQLVYISIAHTGVYKLSEEMFENGSYPKIIDLTDSPLANMFNPPLTKIRNEGVVNLIRIDNDY